MPRDDNYFSVRLMKIQWIALIAAAAVEVGILLTLRFLHIRWEGLMTSDQMTWRDCFFIAPPVAVFLSVVAIAVTRARRRGQM